MEYISLDIETTGLDPTKCDILEIGAYIEDTNKKLPREKLPTFHCYIWKEFYNGSAEALAMNYKILQKIRELKKKDKLCHWNNDNNTFRISYYKQNLLVHDYEVINYFRNFLSIVHNNDSELMYYPNIAGKNVSYFDIPFLYNLPHWNEYEIKFKGRSLDPAILYFDKKKDSCLPSLTECKKRAGFKNIKISHRALDDAWDIIQLLRKKL